MTSERREELRIMITALLEDEEFLKSIFSAKDNEERASILNAKGINITIEETAELLDEGCSQLEQYDESGDRELTVDELEGVAGGGKLRAAVTYGVFIVGGVVVGGTLGLFVGAGALALGTAYAIAVGYSLIAGVATINSRKKKGW